MDSFTWSRWRNFDFKICWRTEYILFNREDIKEKAIGFIEASRLFCRPKENNMAVMFLSNDEFSWCHLTTEEFNCLFKEQ